MITTLHSFVLSIVFFVGLFGVWVGERLIGAGLGRGVASLAGLTLVIAALALRALRARSVVSADKNDTWDRRSIERRLVWLYALGLFGLVLYAIQSDLFGRVFDKPLTALAPTFAGVLAALFPVALVASLVAVLLAELAYAAMAKAPRAETGRVREAMLTGLGLTFALVFAFSAVYVADNLRWKADLSYFRTARPGDATRKLVQSLDAPLEISLFFPPANEVREEVKSYFDDLQDLNDKLKIQDYDQAVDIAKARDLSVTSNGNVVVAKGARRETFYIGVDLDRARTNLKNLDKELQKKILQVAKEKKVAYFVTGHGERGTSESENDRRPTTRDLRELLTALNIQMKNLGAAEGLATDVPSDAGVVFLLGPQKPLMPEEAQALIRYFHRGGRLLLALDPEAGQSFSELLEPLGLTLSNTVLVHDTVFGRRTGQASDKANLVSASFSSHPSISTLGQLGGRAPVLLPTTGSLEEAKQKPAGVSVTFTLHAQPTTYGDANGNFTNDMGDVKKAFELAAAVVRKATPAEGAPQPATGQESEGRAIVLADADALSDLVLRNMGNAYLAADAAKWLNGEEALAGTMNSEADVPLQHTKKQDTVWFYSTIFVAPSLLLGIGFLVTRRRRPKARVSAAPAAAQGGQR